MQEIAKDTTIDYLIVVVFLQTLSRLLHPSSSDCDTFFLWFAGRKLLALIDQGF
jgi:hypothetical protein